MQTASEVIILDSSPDHPSSRTPTGVAYSPGRLFGLSLRCSPPPTMVSPSELFQCPTHSKYFEATPSTTKESLRNKKETSKEVSTEDARISKIRESMAEEKPKRRRRKKATDESQTAEAPRDKEARKTTGVKKTRTRITKNCGEPGNKTLIGKVGKAGNAQAKEPNKGTAVPLSLKSPPAQDVGKGPKDWKEDGLQLEEAMKRRMDWTPTKDTHDKIIDLGDEETENSLETSSRRSLGNLFSEYGFNGTTHRENITTSGNGGPTKRRRIELVDSSLFSTLKPGATNQNDKKVTETEQRNSALPPPKEKKPKKGRKKITTLTARVTARYVVDDNESTGESSKETTGREEDIRLEDTSKSKLSGKGKSNKKAKAPEYIILSPEAAAKSLDEQDLIFGTCSQLEREDSPTTLKEMQMAIRASENCAFEAQAARTSQSKESKLSSVSRLASRRSLWGVAARDLDGCLAQVEFLDMVDVPDISKVTSAAVDTQKNNEKPADQEDSWLEIDDNPEVSSQEKSLLLKKKPVASGNIAAEVPQPTEEKDDKENNSTNQAPLSQPPMPHYGGFTDAELSQQIASYGLKPIKSRKKMIDILQKCWESKHGKLKESAGPASEHLPDNSSIKSLPRSIPGKGKAEKTTSSRSSTKSRSKASSSSSKSTGLPPSSDALPNTTTTTTNSSVASKTSRTTKRKTVKEKAKSPVRSFKDVEEIEDSEDEVIPSPSRLRDRYTTSHKTAAAAQSLPISTAPSPTRTSSSRPQASAVPSNVSEQVTDLPNLAQQITRAVRFQPRLTPGSGRNSRSWYEKILMYDPIVLEEFAAWLNTEGLGLIEEDREVSAGFVREWCENNGICCCWKKAMDDKSNV